MLKSCCLALYALFLSIFLHAQDGCQIKVILDGYTHDTLWFGRTFGKREIPDFFGLRQADGSYELKTAKPIPAGMYAIIYRKNPALLESFQCWVADGQRNFFIDSKVRDPYDATVKGASENEILYRYNKGFKPLDDHLDDAIDQWRYRPSQQNFEKRVSAEKALHDFQQGFLDQYPGTLTAGLIRQTMLPIPPDGATAGSNGQGEAERRWLWQKQHYFDHMDLGTEGFTRHLQWLEATDFYLFRLPPPHPDTTMALIDEVLKKLENSPEAWQYYHKYLTNSLAKMSQYRLDEVFVQMVHKYVDTGKATWPDAEVKRRLVGDAARMEPLFAGRPSPDATFYDQDKNPVRLHGIEAPYTLLFFWMPDCSHCKREIPRLKEIYPAYKDRGLKVLSVCGKYGEETQQCWDFAAASQLPEDWMMVADPERRSNMASLFNLRSFPRLFILDKGKNIVFKRAGGMEDWQLEAVLEGLVW